MPNKMMEEEPEGHERTEEILSPRAKLYPDAYKRELLDALARSTDRDTMQRIHEELEELQRMIAQSRFELDAGRDLTPEYLNTDLAPYLAAMAALQRVFNEMSGKRAEAIVVRRISYQSPVEVSVDGVADVINSLKEDVVPWRRRHAKEIAALKEREVAAEIKKREAEVKEIRARSAKDGADARKLEAEARKLHAEADRQMLENEKMKFELDQSKLKLALELVEKMHPELSEGERVVYAVKMLPALNSIVISDIEFGRKKLNE